ncbi:ArnT family glycosyltransferase [Leptospira bouyouniensis]|nr:phospholipid carrier-dependent glycosyltransferase [Leptospira bouyouniensis]
MVYFLFVLLLFIFGALLGSPDAPFPQGDEIMHIRSIRESLENGSYLIPSLSGLPNPYKPPLLFWLGMVTDQIFGVSYASERMVSVLFGIGSLILIYNLVYLVRNSKTESLLTATLFGFSFLSLKFFGLLMMEGAMVFFLLFYFYSFYQYKRTDKAHYLIIGSFISGIGYLLKGPILHVYIFLFLVSYFYVNVIRFRNGKLTILWNRIIKEKFIIVSFVFTLLIPIFWILYLYFNVPSGKDLLRFFFITENIGKFYATNQSGIRIWFGWLLYTVPFTILFFQLISKYIQKQIQTKHQSYVITFFVFFLLVTTLHLLPNRKDPYYVTPFISFLFLLPPMLNVKWESLLTTNTNQFTILIAYFLLTLISIILRLPFLFIFSILGILMLTSSIWFFQNKNFKWRAILFAQIFLLPLIIFFLLKPMSDPDLKEVTNGVENNSICVVAENPWTAMDVQNKLIDTKVQFALPLTIEENCRNTKYLINYVGATLPKDFEKVNDWYHWKQHLQLNSRMLFRSILKMDKEKFQSEISLWKKGGLK